LSYFGDWSAPLGGKMGGTPHSRFKLYSWPSRDVRNLNGKAAVFVVANQLNGMTTVMVEGAQYQLPKEEWERLPVWVGPIPRR